MKALVILIILALLAGCIKQPPVRIELQGHEVRFGK